MTVADPIRDLVSLRLGHRRRRGERVVRRIHLRGPVDAIESGWPVGLARAAARSETTGRRHEQQHREPSHDISSCRQAVPIQDQFVTFDEIDVHRWFAEELPASPHRQHRHSGKRVGKPSQTPRLVDRLVETHRLDGEVVRQHQEFLTMVCEGRYQVTLDVAMTHAGQPSLDRLVGDRHQDEEQTGQRHEDTLGGRTRPGSDQPHQHGDHQRRRPEAADEHRGSDDPATHRLIHDVLGLRRRESGAAERGTGLERCQLSRHPGRHQGPCRQLGEGDRDHSDDQEGGDGVHDPIFAHRRYVWGLTPGVTGTRSHSGRRPDLEDM